MSRSPTRSSSEGRAPVSKTGLQSQDYSVANYSSLGCSCLPLIVVLSSSLVVSSRNALLEVSQADDAMGCPAPSAWLHMASYMAWASASQQSKLSACQAQLESQKSLFTKRSWMQSWEDAQKWNHFSSLLPMNELMPALLAAFLKYHYSINLKGSQLTSPGLAAKLECSSFPNNMSDLPFQTWRRIKVSGTHFQWLQARSSNGLMGLMPSLIFGGLWQLCQIQKHAEASLGISTMRPLKCDHCCCSQQPRIFKSS